MQLAKAEARRRSLWRGGGGSKLLLFVIADSLSIDYFPHLAEALASEYRVALSCGWGCVGSANKYVAPLHFAKGM